MCQRHVNGRCQRHAYLIWCKCSQQPGVAPSKQQSHRDDSFQSLFHSYDSYRSQQQLLLRKVEHSISDGAHLHLQVGLEPVHRHTAALPVFGSPGESLSAMPCPKSDGQFNKLTSHLQLAGSLPRFLYQALPAWCWSSDCMYHMPTTIAYLRCEMQFVHIPVSCIMLGRTGQTALLYDWY